MDYVKKRAWYIGAGFVFLVIIVLAAILRKYVTYEQLQQHQGWFEQLVNSHYLFAVALFIASYAGFIVATLPVVGPFTMVGSFVFGFWPNVFYSLTSCVIGGTLSFLGLRTIFASLINRWHNERIEYYRAKVQKYGGYYLLMLHFLSILPFFVINVVAVLARIPLKTYIITATIGSIPLVILYSYAAHQLTRIHSIKDLFSPSVIAIIVVLVLIAIMPIFAKRYFSPEKESR